MRKFACVCLFLNLALLMPASVLSFSSSEYSLSFSSDHVSFNTASGYVRLDAGPVRIGSQGRNTLMYSLLDSRSASFEGLEGRGVKTVKGISLTLDGASFFALTYPRFITGFSLDICGFLLGYAHAGADIIDDEYFLSYSERYGYESDVMHAGYRDKHFLFKLKLSHSPVSTDLQVSAGLSFRGLSFVYARGGEAVLLGGRAVKESYLLSLESEHLDFTLSVSFLNDPVRAGTFREIECVVKSAFSCRFFRLSSEQEAFFTQKGIWENSIRFSLASGPLSASWSSDTGVSLSYTAGRVTFFINDEAFGVKYAVRYRNAEMSFTAESSGRIDTLVSLEFP